MSAPALSAADTTRGTTDHRNGGFEHRPELDGLRALAVAAVMIYHFGYAWLPGGFLGVDLFFVLSGYLITSLLLIEYTRTGRISLRRFWARRFRRLLPAVILLLLAVSLYADRLAPPDGTVGLRGDGLATLLYYANWHFISLNASYFQEFGVPSPLRHTWSLSIEEQFYFFWPLVCLALLALCRGRLRALVVVALGLVTASTIAMSALLAADPSRAYYGTDSRIHEILVGALLAIAMHRIRLNTVGPRPAPRVFRLLALGSIIAIVAFMVRLHDKQTFYYHGGSLLFCLLVATLILGMERGRIPSRPSVLDRLLSFPGVVFVGTISYGVYLWHWPIVLWLTKDRLGVDGIILDALRAIATLSIATLSFFLVERPIRRGALSSLARHPARMAVAVPLLVSMTAGVVIAGTRNLPEQAPSWARSADVAEFVELGSADPGAVTVAIVGDSIAKSLLPGFDVAGKKAGVRIIGAAWSGCGVAIGHQLDLDGKSEFAFSEACDAAVPAQYRVLVERYDPDIVWMHSVRERFPMRSPDGSVLEPRTPAHDAALLAGYEQALAALTSRGAVAEISTVVTRSRRFKGTCSQAERADECAADDGADGIYAHMNAVINKFVSSHPGRVQVVGMESIICPTGPPCPDKVSALGDTYLRWDGSHFTRKASFLVAPRMLDLILAAGERSSRP